MGRNPRTCAARLHRREDGSSREVGLQPLSLKEEMAHAEWHGTHLRCATADARYPATGTQPCCDDAQTFWFIIAQATAPVSPGTCSCPCICGTQCH